MTEMVVALIALVPLFLLISLMGKYIDIKHATIQAARYEAWEYTVWYAGQADRPMGYSRSQPMKPLGRTRKEARQRFLSATSLPIASSDSSGWDNIAANPLWTDHTGQRLYTGAGETGSRQSRSLKTPDLTKDTVKDTLGTIDTFFRGMNKEITGFAGQDYIGNIAPGSGKATGPFTAIRDKGYFRANIDLPVQTGAGFTPKAAFRSDTTITGPTDLQFTAQAAVLADGWNSGGRDYTHQQSENASTTPLLNDAAMQTLQSDIAPYIGVPELEPDVLKWGYMKPDVIHPDRLSGGGSQDCGQTSWSGWRGHGLCRFKP